MAQENTGILKKKLLKKLKIGWRLGIVISVILLITIAFFEAITFFSFDKFEGNPGGFIKFHLVHAIITIFIVVVAIVLLLARFVVKPIYQILLAIEDMKSGKLVTPLEIKSNDEFELLAEEFNEMGIQLKEQIQQKVRAEKYSTAVAFAKRVANTILEPCVSLRTNAKLLKEIAKDNPQVVGLTDIILKDISAIEEKLEEISKIEIPEELK